jgi:hypothetical protein
MSVQLSIDQSSFDNITKQLDILKVNVNRSAYSALMKVAFKIKSEAQNRLKGMGHVVTSRLRNSIHVQGEGSNIGDNKESYSDENGKSYSSILLTAALAKGEIAVGSNVEYASSIELGSKPHIIEAKNKKALSNGSVIFGKRVNHPGYVGDSFLYWAMKNVDVTKSTGDDMKENWDKFTTK